MPRVKFSTLGLCVCLGCAAHDELDLFPPDSAPELDAALAPLDAATDALDARDASVEDAASAERPLPRLRYDFSAMGTALLDRVGSAHARVLGGAELDGSGTLTLDGVDDYVDLPNGLLSSRTSATIMVWFEWRGGVCWQRVFDFGNNTGGEGNVGDALSSLFFTPEACGDAQSMVMAEFGARRYRVMGGEFPAMRSTQIALAFDAALHRMSLYQDGRLISEASADFALADIDDVNSWLGRSQWVQDRFAQVRYDEFRLYDRALTQDEVARLASAGPDAP